MPLSMYTVIHTTNEHLFACVNELSHKKRKRIYLLYLKMILDDDNTG